MDSKSIQKVRKRETIQIIMFHEYLFGKWKCVEIKFKRPASERQKRRTTKRNNLIIFLRVTEKCLDVHKTGVPFIHFVLLLLFCLFISFFEFYISAKDRN